MTQNEIRKLEKRITKINRKLERLQMQYRIATGYEFLIPYGAEVRDNKFDQYNWIFPTDDFSEEAFDLPKTIKGDF